MSSPSSDGSSPAEGSATQSQNKKKSNKPSKARLTSDQKNTNHREAENKRRDGLREQYEKLAQQVPGAENDSKSEERLLSKTADYVEEQIVAVRKLIAEYDAKGMAVPDDIRNLLGDDDFGGPSWKSPHMDEYEAKKAQREGKEAKSRNA